MPWTTPRTWTTAELVTAANMNTYISDNLSYLYGNVPATDVGVGDILNNSNVETTFGTLTAGAGTLGTTGVAMGESWFAFTQSSGGAINYVTRLKFGATTVFAYTLSVGSAATLYLTSYRYVVGNMESASAQRCQMRVDLYSTAAANQTTMNTLTASYVMYNTAAENTANATALAVTCQMASATATGYIYHLGTRLFAPLT